MLTNQLNKKSFDRLDHQRATGAEASAQPVPTGSVYRLNEASAPPFQAIFQPGHQVPGGPSAGGGRGQNFDRPMALQLSRVPADLDPAAAVFAAQGPLNIVPVKTCQGNYGSFTHNGHGMQAYPIYLTRDLEQSFCEPKHSRKNF